MASNQPSHPAPWRADGAVIAVAVLVFVVFSASVLSAAVRGGGAPASVSSSPTTTESTAPGTAPIHRPAVMTPSSEVPTTVVAPHLTTVPTDAFASPSGGGVIDASTAEKVFQALYPARSRAVFTHDDATLALIETGVARTYDIARCHFGCPTPPVTPGTVPHSFSAPDQTSYPAFFAAAVNRTGVEQQPVTEVVIFTRSAARSPWLVAFDNSADSSNPLFDAGGDLGQAPPTVGGPDPRTLPAALAAYWQQVWATGAPPPPGPFFQEPGTQEPRDRVSTSRDDDAQQGEQNRRRYTADLSDGPYVVRGLANQVLACGAVRIFDDYTPAAGHRALVQPSDLSEWGPTVAPGTYSRIRTFAVEVACFYVSQAGLSVPFETDPLTYRADAMPAGAPI